MSNCENVYNVYDFDGTIYDGDSTAEFYRYCIKRYPVALLALPKAMWAFLSYILRQSDKTHFKEQFYGFLKYLPDVDSIVSEFWVVNKVKIKEWYLEKRQANDIIISASPDFLLKPVCIDMNVNNLIASKVDPKTGATEGQNCYGYEKVLRFEESFSNGVIEEFYTDSYSDRPLAELAQRSFLVNGDRINRWVLTPE